MTPTMRVPVRYSQIHRAGGQLYWGGGESSSDLQSSIQSWEQLYWGVGGSLTVVFGWRSVAEEPVLLTC